MFHPVRYPLELSNVSNPLPIVRVNLRIYVRRFTRTMGSVSKLKTLTNQGWHKQEQVFFTNRKKHVRNTCFLPGCCEKQVDYGTPEQQFQVC